MGIETERIAQLGRSRIMEAIAALGGCVLGWGVFAFFFIISWIGQRVQRKDCE